MMKIIDEVFATRQDPGQIQVTPQQMKKLEAIHPSTLSELADENGPLIWVMLIPTTSETMNKFLQREISEKELLDQTKAGDTYDCLYLCSASTLPEQRGKGLTKKLCLEGIAAIRRDHPIRTLFAWPFTNEGKNLAQSIARELGLELLNRREH